MARLLLLSLGKLSGAVLEAAARDPRFDHIVVLGRNAAAGVAKVNAVRIGAAVEGLYPHIEFHPFDFTDKKAPDLLRRFAPDIAFAAPSLMPFRRLVERGDRKLMALPFAVWLPLHLAPMLHLREVWAASGLRCPWVAASYPDLVNAILNLTGPGPTAGCGSSALCVPKIRMIADSLSNVSGKAGALDIRLVAQRALQPLLYSEAVPKELPPFLLKVTWHGHDITLGVLQKLKSRMPIPQDAESYAMVASAALDVLGALCGGEGSLLHLSAPNGLIGGYPARVSRKGVVVDLPQEWNLDQALAVNAAALTWDGIAAVEKDGRVAFTDATASAFKALLGRAVARMAPQEAPALATAILQACA